MSIHVFLDSSALRALHPNSLLAEILRQLVGEGALEFHVPSWSRRRSSPG